MIAHCHTPFPSPTLPPPLSFKTLQTGNANQTQVTVAYKEENGRMVPQRVHTVVISCQHDEVVSNETIRKDLMENVIKVVVPAKYLDDDTIYHLNPSGRFVIGGPHGDAGLTGRKIIIDTYGGWGAHGGGAFSGKDPTKVKGRGGAEAGREGEKFIYFLFRSGLFCLPEDSQL